MSNTLKKCEECFVMIRRHRKYQNRILCFKCWRKHFHVIAMGVYRRGPTAIERALNKIYTVIEKTYIAKSSGNK